MNVSKMKNTEMSPELTLGCLWFNSDALLESGTIMINGKFSLDLLLKGRKKPLNYLLKTKDTGLS